MVGGSNITSKLLPSIQVNEFEEKDAILKSEILKIKFEVLCTGLQLINAKLTENGFVAGMKGEFTGCISRLNGVLSPECEPKSEGKKGAINTVRLIGSVGVETIHLEPEEGSVFKSFETSSTCPIGTKVPILGEATLRDTALSTESLTHLLAADPATSLWVISVTPKHKVTLKGSAIAALTGAEHSGLKWSYLP